MMTAGSIVVALLSTLVLLWLLRRQSDARHRYDLALASIVAVVAVGAWASVFTGDWPWHLSLVRWVAGAWLVGWLFVLGIFLVRLLLTLPIGAFAVARTMLSEAINTRLALVFLGVLMLGLPLIPQMIATDQPLRYQIQSFLLYSGFMTMALVSLLTVFLGTWSVAGEMRDKQMHMLASKPLSRASYLAGKWLGLVLLSAVLLGVSGAGIYSFVHLHLIHQRAMDPADRHMIATQVLTARHKIEPIFDEQTITDARQRIETLAQENPQLVQERGGIERMIQQEITRARTAQRSIPPQRGQQFDLSGLGPAKQYDQPIYLRWKLRAAGAPHDARVPLRIIVAERQAVDVQSPVDVTQEVEMDPAMVGDDGTLQVAIVNLTPRGGPTISFPIEDGLVVMYQADSFAMNFVRSMMIIWIRIAFIAAVSIGLAALLSFPVAALTAMVVFIGASLAQFILNALRFYGPGDSDANAIETFAGWIAYAFVWPLSMYAEVGPLQRLVQGELVPWADVYHAAIWIGLLWSVVIAVLAWLFFSNRELARVQV